MVGRGNQQRTRGFHWHSLENISSTSMESTPSGVKCVVACVDGKVLGSRDCAHDGELVGSGNDPMTWGMTSEHAAYWISIIQPIKSKNLPGIYISSQFSVEII